MPQLTVLRCACSVSDELILSASMVRYLAGSPHIHRAPPGGSQPMLATPPTRPENATDLLKRGRLHPCTIRVPGLRRRAQRPVPSTVLASIAARLYPCCMYDGAAHSLQGDLRRRCYARCRSWPKKVTNTGRSSLAAAADRLPSSA
jgi:hypothetical protein